MPASTEYAELADQLFAPLRRGLSPRVTACSPTPSRPASSAAPARPVVESGLSVAELEARLVAAHERTAELEARLVATENAWAAAEQQITQLEDRNRELATDVDNALDQLAGHALHAEQERLIRPPTWSPWPASTDREGHTR